MRLEDSSRHEDRVENGQTLLSLCDIKILEQNKKVSHPSRVSDAIVEREVKKGLSPYTGAKQLGPGGDPTQLIPMGKMAPT